MNRSRIELLAEYTKGFNKLGDIACDHTKISITAVANGYVKESIASDIAQGPIANAKSTVILSGLQDKITCVKANGLDALDDNVDVVIIAGLGGTIISGILTNGIEKLTKVKRLILQANVGQVHCRTFAVNNGYKIVDEVIFEDMGVVYEIIVCEKGEQVLTEMELEFGPVLLKQQSPLFIEKIKKELEYYNDVIKSIPKDKQNNWLSVRREMIKEILANVK